MIYVTGDCHADFGKFNTDNFPEQKEMTKNDYVIVLGDFGGIWSYYGESKQEKYWLRWLENKPFTTLFVDGNHENFDRLYDYPVKEFCGGLVHEIRTSVLHLMRGQVFNIDGCKLFSFGGARSHDIQGGVLDMDAPDFQAQRKRAEKDCMPYRINHLTWWEQEMPNVEEMQAGRNNLEANGWKVDYILTHDCAASTLALLSQGTYKSNELNKYFEEIREKCEFQRWLFGHHHRDIQINSQEILFYDQIVRVW